MKIWFLLIVGTGITAFGSNTVTLTGWFGDEACAAPKLARGTVGPTNPDCSRKCIAEGKALVFIDKAGKRLLKVKDFHGARDELGYHVEVSGTIDGDVLLVDNVKRLGSDGAACARRPASVEKK